MEEANHKRRGDREWRSCEGCWRRRHSGHWSRVSNGAHWSHILNDGSGRYMCIRDRVCGSSVLHHLGSSLHNSCEWMPDAV